MDAPVPGWIRRRDGRRQGQQEVQSRRLHNGGIDKESPKRQIQEGQAHADGVRGGRAGGDKEIGYGQEIGPVADEREAGDRRTPPPIGGGSRNVTGTGGGAAGGVEK